MNVIMSSMLPLSYLQIPSRCAGLSALKNGKRMFFDIKAVSFGRDFINSSGVCRAGVWTAVREGFTEDVMPLR